MQRKIQESQNISEAEKETSFVVVKNAAKQFRINTIQKLNDRIFFLDKLNEKIQNLPLTYFVFEKNTNYINEIYEMLKKFDVSGLHENNFLQDSLKKNDFLDYIFPGSEM